MRRRHRLMLKLVERWADCVGALLDELIKVHRELKRMEGGQ